MNQLEKITRIHFSIQKQIEKRKKWFRSSDANEQWLLVWLKFPITRTNPVQVYPDFALYINPNLTLIRHVQNIYKFNPFEILDDEKNVIRFHFRALCGEKEGQVDRGIGYRHSLGMERVKDLDNHKVSRAHSLKLSWNCDPRSRSRSRENQRERGVHRGLKLLGRSRRGAAHHLLSMKSSR